MKWLITVIVRWLMDPLREYYNKYNGWADPTRTVNLDNAAFLGLVKKFLVEGHTATINVKGYSMRPFLEHMRDKVLLKPVDELHVGDAVLAEIRQGVYVLHRITAFDGERIVLMGDGNIRGTEICERKDIIGIVAEYIRPNHTIPANDAKLCRRIRWWYKLLPIRRVLLFFYRALIY